MDELEQTIEDVNGSVTIEREVPKYDLVPQGMHKATCCESVLKESTHPKSLPGTMVLKLTFQLETKYTFNDEEKHFLVWSKPFGLYFGAKAGLHQCFKSLTGNVPDILLNKETFTKNGKKFTREVFNYQCFVGMNCEVLMKHNKSEDGTMTFANIAEYIASEDQQAFNFALAQGEDAPEPKKEEPKEEPKKEEKKEEPKEEPKKG